METKILSINISNVCIEVSNNLEPDNSTINQIVKQIKEMFQDSQTLKDHINTIYDDDNDILYHVRDGKLVENPYKVSTNFKFSEE